MRIKSKNIEIFDFIRSLLKFIIILLYIYSMTNINKFINNFTQADELQIIKLVIIEGNGCDYGKEGKQCSIFYLLSEKLRFFFVFLTDYYILFLKIKIINMKLRFF